MRKAYISILAMLAIAGGLTMGSVAPSKAQQLPPNDKRPIITGASLLFGAYDPHGDFKDDKSSSIEHIFIPWEDVALSTLDSADNYALQQGRSLLITVEPWSWFAKSKNTPIALYNGIMSGKYDSNMRAICSKTSTLRSPVVIRWGQEMDDNNGQFLWSPWSPEQFVNAYRHVVTECQRYDKTARFMWSVQGDKMVDAYYPGDDYLDMVGVTLFGLQKRDKDEVGRDRSFEELLEPIYRRVAHFGKPVYVAEFGYEGDSTYVRDWAKSVARPQYDFPLLRGVIYFNDKEVYPWFGGYGLPNWRVVQGAKPSTR